MALRIGGTIASPGGGSLLTWGSVRSPLVLYGSFLLIDKTTYSRTFPDTTGDPYPKFFIWESGSLFSWYKGNGAVPPYYWIENDDPDTLFSIGLWPETVDRQVDNQQFDELIGEDVDTDGGTFAITLAAHDYGPPPQLAFQRVTGFVANEIYTIGKLTPV